MTQRLHGELEKFGIKSWFNEYSNTVFFQRPSQGIMDYYGLAPDVHPEQGNWPTYWSCSM